MLSTSNELRSKVDLKTKKLKYFNYTTLIIFSWLYLLPLSLLGQAFTPQDPVFSKDHFIKGCSRYRDLILEDVQLLMSSFASLADSMAVGAKFPQVHAKIRDHFIRDLLEPDREIINPLLANIKWGSFYDTISMEPYYKWIDKYKILIERFQYLVDHDFISESKPYPFDSLDIFWEEFNFYRLSDQMKVATIGSGTGMVSKILLLSEFPLHVTITDNDTQTMKWQIEEIGRIKLIHPNADVEILFDGERKLNLEDLKYDRIIMRDVFHHMEFKEDILKSIIPYLAPGGHLILVEPTREIPRKTRYRCPQALTIESIKEILAANQFHLLEFKYVNKAYIFRFTPSDL